MMAPEPRVPVQAELAGQQAICPAWSTAHNADFLQQRLGEPRLAHDMPSDEHWFWRGRSRLMLLGCSMEGGKNGE